MGYSLTTRTTPNRSARSGKPIYLVTHHTEGSYAGSVAWLQNPDAQASCDEVIRHDGKAVTVLNPDVRMKTWQVGNANSLCYGFESEGHVGDTFPTSFYDTLADRMVRAQREIRRVYGVTIPLRFSTRKGEPGIVSHKLVAEWYGGSDHTDGELNRRALLAAIARRLHPETVYVEVWAGGRRRYYAKTGGGRVVAMLKNRASAIGSLALKFGRVTVKRVKR